MEREPEPYDVAKDEVATLLGEAEPAECYGCPHTQPFACFRCPVIERLRKERRNDQRGCSDQNQDALG